MTREEKAVIDAAIRDHSHGCAPEWCGGSPLDPCLLANAIDSLAYARKALKVEKEWVPAQLGNVMAGDRMRLPGRADSEATVEWARISEWHIKQGRDTEGNDAWWNDHYAPHAMARVMMTGRDVAIEQPATLPIEIEMDAERRAVFLTQVSLAATKVDPTS